MSRYCAEMELRRAEVNVQGCYEDLVHASHALNSARQRLIDAQIAVSKAQMISGPCPICEAEPDRPCVGSGIGNFTHTARAATALRADTATP